MDLERASFFSESVYLIASDALEPIVESEGAESLRLLGHHLVALISSHCEAKHSAGVSPRSKVQELLTRKSHHIEQDCLEHPIGGHT